MFYFLNIIMSFNQDKYLCLQCRLILFILSHSMFLYDQVLGSIMFKIVPFFLLILIFL